MSSLFRKLLFGEEAIKEYSSVSINGDIREHVYLKTKSAVIDISSTHWLLSLDPVVIGVWVEKKEDIAALDERAAYKIYFNDAQTDAGRPAQHAVAVVGLEFFNKIEEKNGTLFLLKAKKSRIYHLSPLKVFLLFFKYYKKPRLSFNQFKSLVSAHSYPRRVRVISFRKGDDYNIFPMDLLGDIVHDNRFVFGLRHSNRSLPDIMETKKMVVSEVSSVHKDIIYQLGKHHTATPPKMDALPFKTIETQNFHFYIPEWVESYKEIEIIKTLDLGSHMLLWGKLANEKKLKTVSYHLFHIPFLLYLHQKRKGYNYLLA